MSGRSVKEAVRARSFPADRAAWVAFVAALVAVPWAAHAWLHRRAPLDAAPPAAGAELRLTVLAWDRVAADGADRHVPVGRVEEHLEALRGAGFHAVTLRQVHDALLRGAPLPARPVLLTFDGGHLQTQRAVDPLLRRMRWPAAMFLDPRLPQARHPAYAYWDRLGRMVASGLWDLGTLGPWPEAGELVARRLAGYEVLAAARGGARADADGPTPPLVFENGLFGVNDRGADPQRLFRVRVRAEWTGGELVERLERALAAPGAVGAPPAAVEAGSWVPSVGTLAATAEGLRLAGAPRGEVWLAGSEWARDFVLEAEVRPERGPFWIVQQAMRSREQWRWGGTGRVRALQRLRPGAPIEVVSQVPAEDTPGAWHTLRIVRRGAGVLVEWDGERVREMPRRVSARWRGAVGIATGSPGTPGTVAFRNVRFAPLPYEVRPVAGSPAPGEVRGLLGDAGDVAALSPPGLVHAGGTLARRPSDRELLALLAAHGAWDLVPSVELSDPASAADEALAARVADVAGDEGWAGVRLLLPSASAHGGVPETWARTFGRRGLRLVAEPRRAGGRP